ncbi:MAG: type II toxin-antitoxin system YafQ family toxin [Lachnospiraceae bacterium]|nr:type II toxin-antitoxin system YafQ family toxin [Lachnospiraceae bacterium]
MLDVRYSTKFKKDFKACKKRGYNLDLLQNIIDTLRIPAPLQDSNRDHTLTGNYAGFRECHITPDWLLIYKQTNSELQLSRTGTHADLFGM